MNHERFLGRLKHLVLGHPVMSHPIWPELELGLHDMDALRVFSIHYYHHVLRTRLYDAAALAHTPSEGIQVALASILWDEYGQGDGQRSHPAQFRKILRALSLDIEEVENTPRLPELERYSRTHFGLCSPATPWQALGAVGFAMEWPIPYLYEPLVRAYRKIAGLSDDDLEFLLEHIPTDEDHSAMMVGAISPYLEDEAVRKDLVEGALRSMDARERLIEAIYREMESCSKIVTVCGGNGR